MRIGVDASALTDQPTGVGNYIRPLLTRLVADHPEVTWYLYGNEPITFPAVPNVVIRVSTPKRRGPLWQNTQLASMIRADGLDAYWAANGLVPMRLPAGLAVVVTVHDLVYQFASETLPTVSYWGRRLSQPQAVKRADRLVTVSAATAADVAKENRRRADAVVHPLVSERFGEVPGGEAERVRAALDLPAEYLLATGTMEPRKNFGALIRAYVRCRERGVELPLLAIAGRKGWKDEELETLASAAEARGLVRRLGYVSDEDLAGLYAGATAFVLPSLYEGFGMPLLEAQLAGTPVIHGPHPSMVEAAGGFGTVVGTSEDELAHALAELAAGELELRKRPLETISNSVADGAATMWRMLSEAMEARGVGADGSFGADAGDGAAGPEGAAEPDGTSSDVPTSRGERTSSSAYTLSSVQPPAGQTAQTWNRIERPERRRGRPQLLVVAPRLPYPVQGGDRLRIYQVAKELAKLYDLTLVSMVDLAEDFTREIPDDGVFVAVERFLKPKRESYRQVALALPTWVPLQRAYYRHGPIAARLRELAPQFDGALAHLVRTADWIVDLDLPRFLEMTDAVSLNYRRVRGKWAEKWREFLWWTYMVDSMRLRRFERAMVDRFDATFLVSDVDRDYLADRHELQGSVIVAPNGVDVTDVPFIGPGSGFDIALIGNFDSFQNTDAAQFLVHEVFPLVKERYPQARVRLVGRMPGERRGEFEAVPGVDVTGQVDSIVDAVAGAAVGVAPVRLGAGVQNKVLEYLALGLPAVVTSLAQEGIEARDGVELVVADGAESFAEAVCDLLADRARGARMAQAGRTLMEEEFSWESRLAPLVAAVAKLVPPHP